MVGPPARRECGPAEVRHDTEVTPEADVTDEVNADPTPEEASPIPTAAPESGAQATPQSEGPATERPSGAARKPLVTRAQADKFARSAATALGAAGSAIAEVARFGAGAVRTIWRTLQVVPPAVRGAMVAAMLMLLGVVGAISMRNPLGLVCIVVVIPVCASILGALGHRWFVGSRTAVQPHAMGSVDASAAALQRSVHYVDNKLALALTSMGTDHHQQAVVALFQAKTAVELTLGTEQDSPNYDVALRADDYALNPRSQARPSVTTAVRESNSLAAS